MLPQARSPTITGPGVDYAYDGLSRVVSETRSGQAMSYQYDAAGDRTRITWPDASPNTLYVTYAYDMLNRVMQNSSQAAWGRWQDSLCGGGCAHGAARGVRSAERLDKRPHLAAWSVGCFYGAF